MAALMAELSPSTKRPNGLQTGNLHSLALENVCGAQAYSRHSSLPSVWANAILTLGHLHTQAGK